MAEKTPLSSKRNRESLFSSPDSEVDIELKRHCQVISDTADSSFSMSDPDTLLITYLGAGDSDVFTQKMLETFQNKHVLAALGTMMVELVRPMFREEMTGLMTKHNALAKSVVELESHLKERDDAIQSLSERLDRTEQYSRRNNLRISGILEEEEEDSDTLVINMARSIGVDISESDIDVNHRVPRRPVGVKSPPRPILVRFVSNAVKRRILKARSSLKNVHVPGKPKIYVNEDLTKPRATLAKEARQMVAEKRFESAWVTSGVILIKMHGGSVKKVANRSHFEEACKATALKTTINLTQLEME